jgi:6-phosphogluconolactonase (cycloisomerase 2 family)
MRFLLGGYSPDSGGIATGIGVLVAGAVDDGSAGGPLAFTGEAASADSPSWVTWHAETDVAYATLEARGAVQAFHRVGEERFAPLGDPVEAGEAVCHVAVSPDGRMLIATCWGDGRVVTAPLSGGRPGAPTLAAPATDPNADDGPGADDTDPDLAALLAGGAVLLGGESATPPPAAPPEPDPDDEPRVSRAHQSVFLPGGLVATSDLGFDLVRFWRLSGTTLKPLHDVALPPGSGPRHMVWHPSGHLYVVTEYSCEVFVLAPDESGRWRIVGGTALGAGTLPGDSAAELAPSRDGAFLYAGVRGSNTIAALAVRGAGESLTPVALVEAGVDWPRHHRVVRDTLLVAGERSDDVVSLTLDIRSGVPGRVRYRAAVPSPTCITPFA